MIEVIATLYPKGDRTRPRVLGRIEISNDATGTKEVLPRPAGKGDWLQAKAPIGVDTGRQIFTPMEPQVKRQLWKCMKCKSFFGWFEHTDKQPCPDCGGVVLPHVDPRTLEDWHRELKTLATTKGFEWLIGDAECYVDYYNDGAEPDEALDDEITNKRKEQYD
jgi:DNA-directed RNA polymerase subunit RPC12/RpoP